MKFCVYCGTQLEDTAKFCPGCGKAVTSPAPTAPAAPARPMSDEEQLDAFFGTGNSAPAASVAPARPMSDEEQLDAFFGTGGSAPTTSTYGNPYAYTPAPAPARQSGVMSIIGFVLSMAGVTFCWVPVFGMLLSVGGIVLSAIGKKKGLPGLGKAGLIIGIIFTVVSFIVTVAEMS